MSNPNLLDFIPLAEDFRVTDVVAPTAFVGESLAGLALRSRFGVFVIAIKKEQGTRFVFLPGPGDVIEPKDVLVVIGKEDDILRMGESDGDKTPRNGLLPGS